MNPVVKTDSKKNVLRVLHYTKSSFLNLKLDPLAVSVLSQAAYMRDIFGRLVEVDESGKYKLMLASEMTMVGNEYHIKLNESYTCNGNRISSSDVVKTFHRLYRLNTNTHGSIRLFFNESLKVEDQIFAPDGNSIVLKFAKPHYSELFFPLLTSVDYSILYFGDKDILDPINYSETTGAYCLSKDSEVGQWEFKANTSSPYFNEQMFPNVHFVISDSSNLIPTLKAGDVDYVPPHVVSNLWEGQEQLNVGNLTLFYTQPVFIRGIFFQNGLERLSAPMRQYLGSLLKQTILSHFDGQIFKDANSLVPEFGEGDLTQHQKNELLNIEVTSYTKLPKISIDVAPKELELFKVLLKNYKFIDVISMTKPPWTVSEKEQPDAFIASIDTANRENLSLISHFFYTGVFGRFKPDSQTAWIKNYLDIRDRRERIQMFRQLQFDTLKNFIFVPFTISPAKYLLSPNLKTTSSLMFANVPIWTIQKR